MKILVLGCGGFIGQNLLNSLSKKNFDVRGFDRPKHVSSVIEMKEDALASVEWFEGDFQSISDVETAVNGCDIVYHLVSTTQPKSSNEDPVFDISSNLVATVNMLKACVKYKIKKVIFISSGGTVYGTPEQVPILETHPKSPICSYGITKLAIEKYLSMHHLLHGLDYQVIRLGNPYGPLQRPLSTQGAIVVFLYKALKKESIEVWGDGSVVRDFVYIDDVVDALIQLLGYDGKEKVFNLGGGQRHSINQILDYVDDAVGEKVNRVYIKSRDIDVLENVLDINLIGKELGWSPKTSLRDGMINTADYIKRHIL